MLDLLDALGSADVEGEKGVNHMKEALDQVSKNLEQHVGECKTQIEARCGQINTDKDKLKDEIKKENETHKKERLEIKLTLITGEEESIKRRLDFKSDSSKFMSMAHLIIGDIPMLINYVKERGSPNFDLEVVKSICKLVRMDETTFKKIAEKEDSLTNYKSEIKNYFAKPLINVIKSSPDVLHSVL